MPVPFIVAGALAAARVAAPAIARAAAPAAGKMAGGMARNSVPYMLGRMSAGGGEAGETRNENFSQGTASSTSPDNDRARFAYMHGLSG
jgi:hypothetical protein